MADDPPHVGTESMPMDAGSMAGETYITHLGPDVFVDKIGANWKDIKVRHLTFSSDTFKLETLGDAGKSMSADDIARGIRLLKLERLESLDVCDNSLSELECVQADLGFESLRILKARRNDITRVALSLPLLVELNLGYNKLTMMPPLVGLDLLQVLIVGHNEIRGSWNQVKERTTLRRLDLSHNQFMLSPSQLSEGLDCLKALEGLQNLRLSGNPFGQFFPEYQYYAVDRLEHLERLDDQTVTPQTREQAKATCTGVDLSSKLQDDIFRERREKGADSDLKEEALAVDSGVPLIGELAMQLDEAIMDPGEVMKMVKRFVSMVDRIAIASHEEFEQIFVVLAKQENAKEATTNAIDNLLQGLTLLIERHGAARLMLLRCLAKLAIVHTGGLGEQCILTLGRLMGSGEEQEKTIIEVIAEIIIPQLQDTNAKLNDPSVNAIVKGLASLKSDNLASALSPLVAQISKWFKDYPMNDNVVSLMATVLKIPANAVKACKDHEVPDLAIKALENRGIVTQDSLRALYLNVLSIFEHTAGVTTAVIEQYFKAGVHERLMKNLKEKTRENDLTRLTTEDLLTCSRLINVLVVMMQENTEILEVLVKGENYLLDILILAPRCTVADPLMLASSIDGIRVILEQLYEDASQIKHLQTCRFTAEPEEGDVVAYCARSMSKLTPMLQYLGDKKYTPLFQMAMRHSAANREGDMGGRAPPLNSLTNKEVQIVFVAIIRLIKFFTSKASKNKTCDEVSESLNQQQREKILFQLLQVPGDEVKAACLDCIKEVNLDELDTEEVGILVQLLADNQDFSNASTAELLEKVIAQLQRLANDKDSAAGESFRKDHAVKSIKEVFQILKQNSARPTYGCEAEEIEKSRLSMACVNFVRCMTRITDLRKALRNKDLSDQLRQALKNEDDYHTPKNQEIVIERTWAGRSIDALLACMIGNEKLDPHKKVAFRVVLRLADILEGRCDCLDEEVVMSHQLAAREARMWDDVKMHRHLSYLDDSEWDDRIAQQETFSSFGGLGRILMFLVGPYTDTMRGDTEIEIAEAQATDHFIAAIQTKGEVMAAEKDDKERKDRAKCTPDEIELEDEDADEDEDTGPKSKHHTRAEARRALMHSVMGLHGMNVGASGDLFVKKVQEFSIDERFFLDIEKGRVMPAFHLSALLRCAFAMLTVPVSMSIRKDTVDFVRDKVTVRWFMGNLRQIGCLTCHIAAKFLRVMSLVLALDESALEESDSSLFLFDILSLYMRGLSGPTLRRLKQVKDKPLGLHEQVLLTEMARLCSVMVSNVPYFKFSRRPEAQLVCVGQCLERIMHQDLVSLIVQMILYDQQVDVGRMHGEFINERFVRSCHERQGMREYCAVVLATICHRCLRVKYNIFEALTRALVFEKMTIRRSFMSDMLNLSQGGLTRVAVEDLMSEKNDRAERVMILAPITIFSKGKLCLRDVAISTHSLHILSHALHPWETMCAVCPPERFCPKAPIIETTRTYNTLTRISRGFGNQMITMAWATDSAQGEEFDIIVCHKASDRDAILSAVWCLSAPPGSQNIADHAAKQFDHLSAEVIQQHVTADWIAALTFATRVDKDRLALWVLTDSNLFEFQFNFDTWGINPDKADEYAEIDAIGPQFEDLEEMQLKETMLGERKPEKLKFRDKALGQTAYRQHLKKDVDSRRGPGTPAARSGATSRGRRHKVNEKRVTARDRGDSYRLDAGAKQSMFAGKGDEAAMNAKNKKTAMLATVRKGLLTPMEHWHLSTLSMAAYYPGSEPELSLDIGHPTRTVRIRFFDDAAREQWRRALASVLNSSDTAAQWVREWSEQKDVKTADKQLPKNGDCKNHNH